MYFPVKYSCLYNKKKLSVSTDEGVSTKRSMLIKNNFKNSQWQTVTLPCTGGEGSVPPIIAYTGVPPKRSIFLNLQVYKRVGITQVEVYERVGKSEYLDSCQNMN